jgi:hypothetical protein
VSVHGSLTAYEACIPKEFRTCTSPAAHLTLFYRRVLEVLTISYQAGLTLSEIISSHMMKVLHEL